MVAAVPAFAGTSTTQSPTVTFATPGTKTVTLQVCNATYPLVPPACDTKTVTITVLDPAPAILTVTSGPIEVAIPQPVHLAATGAGKPPLAFTWRVLDANLATVATLSGNVADWDTTSAAAGLYAIVLDLTNGDGTLVSSLPIVVLVDPDPRIFWSGFEDGPPDSRPWDAMVSEPPG